MHLNLFSNPNRVDTRVNPHVLLPPLPKQSLLSGRFLVPLHGIELPTPKRHQFHPGLELLIEFLCCVPDLGSKGGVFEETRREAAPLPTSIKSAPNEVLQEHHHRSRVDSVGLGY